MLTPRPPHIEEAERQKTPAWLAILLLVAILGIAVACAENGTSPARAEEPDYELYYIVPDDLIFVRAVNPYSKSSDISIVRGVQEIGRKYKIKKIVPITRYYSETNITGGVYLHVEPLKPGGE